MILYPSVCVHGLAQVLAARAAAAAAELPVTLLSARGAAGYAGCGWWRALMQAAEGPGQWNDLLDCDGDAGHAMAALRIGQVGLVLDRATPAFGAVAGAAAACGAWLLPMRPASLDLAERGAERRLAEWLRGGAAGADITQRSLPVG